MHFAPRLLPASLFTGRSVSLEMIRAGWGTTYVQSGAEYGSVGKDEYIRVEEQAKLDDLPFAYLALFLQNITDATLFFLSTLLLSELLESGFGKREPKGRRQHSTRNAIPRMEPSLKSKLVPWAPNQRRVRPRK